MRFLFGLVSLLSLSILASAADLKVKITDPHDAVVAGAQVQLLSPDQSAPLEILSTSADGTVLFRNLPAHTVHLRVLAQGFAPQSADATPGEPLTLQLHLATSPETVVVSATRGPLPDEASGTTSESFSAIDLDSIQPVSSGEFLRFVPGAVINAAGRRGGISSLFVRGGDSRYNKVIVDGVPVNDPGGTFDFGVLPLQQADRVEFLRGAQSALYGSDAMTSVLQVWTRSGVTRRPELRLGADGGTFETSHGYLSLAGSRGPFDYNAFADQFVSNGQGPNDEYANSLQGANVGFQLAPGAALRFRTRHSNSRSGVPSEWDFNGQALMPPDLDQRARQNNFQASAELTLTGPSRWQHRFTGFEYNHVRSNVDDVTEPLRASPLFGNIDFPFHSFVDINRAGFEYQGDYLERSWARSTFGYQFEDENGFVGDLTSPPLSHGLRLNHAVYAEQVLQFKRLSVVAGARFVHNDSFGNKAVPRVALAYQVLRGGDILSGTRPRFSYATGIKEPRLEESFASGPFILPNPNLKAEQNRAFEAGFDQKFWTGKFTLTATYFNNLFTHQIDFATLPNSFVGHYVNVNESIAHGAELALHGRMSNRLAFDAAYNYTSTQILKEPFAFDPLLFPGQPLLRRPRHSGSMLLTYTGARLGGSLGLTAIGRRPDSDFLGFGVDHAAGYARVDLGAWYAINSRVTAYANVENALNDHYNEVVGYPALRANFRAGMRFRLGGE